MDTGAVECVLQQAPAAAAATGVAGDWRELWEGAEAEVVARQ